MTFKTILAFTGFCLFAGALWQWREVTKENERLKSNQEILLEQTSTLGQAFRQYKTQDSLNAIKVEELRLTLKEVEKYRSEYKSIINDLAVNKKDLTKIISAQAETMETLKALTKDSITEHGDSMKCFNYKSKFLEASGCLNLCTDSLSLQVHTQESLTILESVKYKRFLGFLWKTNKIKSREVDVVSNNPCSKIVSAEVIAVTN